MKQVKYFMTDKKANEWIKENPDKEVIDIKFSTGGFAVIYEIIITNKQTWNWRFEIKEIGEGDLISWWGKMGYKKSNSPPFSENNKVFSNINRLLYKF